jgi:hypothetical protein
MAAEMGPLSSARPEDEAKGQGSLTAGPTTLSAKSLPLKPVDWISGERIKALPINRTTLLD